MNTTTKKTVTSTSHAEPKFVKFICDIIPKIHDKNGKKWLEKFKVALKDIRQLKSDLDMKQEKFFYTDVKYSQPVVRFAYLYAYSVLHTCIVHHHFLNYLKECADLRRIISGKKSLNICCLGGGPGVEAIAISKIINDLVNPLSPIGSHPENSEENVFTVHVTIIDICKEWETEMLAIMNAVNNCPDILNAGRIKISAKFIEADLLKDIKPNLEKEIGEADIVTTVKLGGDIQLTTPQNLKKLCKNIYSICKLLKANSCLFVMESAGGSTFSRLKNAVKNASKSASINSSEHQSYSLKPNSLLKIETILASPTSGRSGVVPTRMTTVSSCIWVKNEQQCDDKKEQEGKENEKHCEDKKERKSKKKKKQLADKTEQESKEDEQQCEDKKEQKCKKKQKQCADKTEQESKENKKQCEDKKVQKSKKKKKQGAEKKEHESEENEKQCEEKKEQESEK